MVSMQIAYDETLQAYDACAANAANARASHSLSQRDARHDPLFIKNGPAESLGAGR
jgi:hypothetical protein